MKAAASAAILLMLLAARAARAQGESGEDIFNTTCVMCHAPTGGGEGPPLAGVVGRRSASVAGFPYTPALKASGITWSAAELDRFLADPQKAVPGTAMVVSIPDPVDRAAVITYLKGQH